MQKCGAWVGLDCPLLSVPTTMTTSPCKVWLVVYLAPATNSATGDASEHYQLWAKRPLNNVAPYQIVYKLKSV